MSGRHRPRPERGPSSWTSTNCCGCTVERGASDLHLKVGNVPFVRVDGALGPLPVESLTAADTESYARALLNEHKSREFAETSEADIGYTLSGVGRFRINVFRQRGVVGLAVRRVRSEVPTFEELRLPSVMQELADSPRGLVLDHRAHRHRQDDHDRLDDRTHQPYPPRAHRHDRGPDRGDARRRALDRSAARDRDRHGLVLGRAQARDPPGSRRHLHRRDPRPRVGAVGDPGGRDRTPRDLDASHDRLHGDDQPGARPVPAAAAAGGPHVVRGITAWHRVAATGAQGRRQGPRARRRGPDQHGAHLRPHRRSGQDRHDRRRARTTASSTGCRRSTSRSCSW